MSKVPCGGFKLDENFLGMNENDELSLLGGGSEGKAYQYVVTDGDGTAKWKDRLAYDDSKLVVDDPGLGAQFVKVADEVPSWATVDSPIKFWMSDGTNTTVTPENNVSFGNGSFVADGTIFIIATDNSEFESVGESIVFPEKGVYFFASVPDELYVTGIASADSDTPEITWDGDIGEIKKLDEKFLPEPLILYVH